MAKKKAKTTANIVATMLRLPENLRDTLKKSADEAGSTLNREMVERLEASFLVRAHMATLEDMLAVTRNLALNAASHRMALQLAADMRARPDWYNGPDAATIAESMRILLMQIDQDHTNIGTLGIIAEREERMREQRK